jgi:hypothetical protein
VMGHLLSSPLEGEDGAPKARRKGGQRRRRCPPFRLPSRERSGIHLPPQGGKIRTCVAIASCVLAASVGWAHAEGETVGLWIKNTSPATVVVTVDGAPACTLEAPLYRPCHDKITQLTPNKKTCTTNNLKISCITDVKASGVAIRLKRSDGVEYNVRAGKDANLYLCIEPAGLTDCFGTKLH